MALTPWTRQEEWYQQMINASTGNYLPSISAQDAGKVMTVESDGSWGVENVPSELPAVTASDKDKFLHTDASTGNLEWSAVNEVPAVGSSDKDKYLHTNASTGDLEWSAVSGGSDLPAVTASDAGKVLTVQAQATKGTVIVPEQSIASYSSHNAVLSNTNNTPFVDGASVIVTADGVDYVATVIDNKGELQAYFMDNYSAGIILSDNTMTLYDTTDTIAEISVNLVNISGEWVAANPSSGGGALFVTETNGTLDKTWQEINDADFAVVLAYKSNIGATAHMPVNFCNEGKGTYDVACLLQGATVYYSAESTSGYPELQS